MVGNDVDDNLDVRVMQRGDHLVEVFEGADLRVHVAVVIHVVSSVCQRRRVERAQPHGIDTQFLQIRNPRGDALQVTDAVAIGVGEAAGVDLIDDSLPPPIGGIEDIVRSKRHGARRSFLDGCGWLAAKELAREVLGALIR